MAKNAPIISIVTPSFNQGEFLAETIESVLTQKGEFYIDYIIQDGNSTDNSVEIIKEYEAKLKQNCGTETIESLTFFVEKNSEFPFLNCLGISFRWESKKDGGHAKGLNIGLKKAIGQYAAFLNSDDIYENSAFQSAIDQFESADVLYGNAFNIDASGNIISVYPTKSIEGTDLYHNCFISQPASFFRRTLLEEDGYFNENTISLDYEFWLRLYSKGRVFKYSRSLFASNRVHGKTLSNTKRKQVAIQDIAIVKHYSGYVPKTLNIRLIREYSLVWFVLDLVAQLSRKLQTYYLNLSGSIGTKLFLRKIIEEQATIFPSSKDSN